ncbi:MAG: hypothetical protein CMA63_06735 [Euryarchaeota archaeon]|nr:hypothetical protein [Euryarchaeota archaeon]|tara:strand:- start:9633 stop:10487 length:855 start_codon:yes stop_codon:yes gene_type:complete
MLNLSSLPTTAAARIAKCVPRRDAGGSIVWDVDVVVDISSEEDAKMVESFVPGTIRQYKAGHELSSNGSAKVAGGFDVVRVFFDEIDGSEQIASGHADVRQCVANVKGDSSVLVVKFRVHGLLPHAAADLAYSLDDCVDVRVESHRAVSSSSSESRNQDLSNLVGSLIAIEDTAGIVIKVDEESILLSSLVGSRFRVKHSGKAYRSLQVKFVDSKIQDFAGVCLEETGHVLLWNDVIEAIGLLYARNELLPAADFSWVIEDQVLEQALDVLQRRVKPESDQEKS